MTDAQRLADLEARVAALEAELARRRAAPPPTALPPGQPPRRARLGRRFSAAAFTGEDMLGKVGIVLLLVGVVFFLKWTIDQGWLTPGVRVLGAAALGAALVAGGLRLRTSRPALAGVLAGGGLAALYGSLFAASLLYGMMAPGVALALAALVAAASVGLAVWADLPLLATVGTLGALALPLVIYEDPASLRLTLGFVALVVAGGTAAWYRTRWPGLLAALALGAWATLAVLRWKAGFLVGTERHLFQAVVVLTWAAVGLVPLAARRAEGEETGVWAALPRLLRPVPLAVWASAVGFFGLTALLWHLSDPAQATLAAALAVAYGAAALAQRDEAAEALGFAAVLLAGWAAATGLPEPMRMGGLVAIFAIGATLAHRRAWMGTQRLTDGLTTLATVGALVYYSDHAGAGTTALGIAAVFAGVGALAVGAMRRGVPAAGAYLIGVHALALAALRYALKPLALGTAFVNGAWGLYAVALVVAGLRTGHDRLRTLGLGTLALTVGKMLLFDLRGIPMAARVVIFVGLGGLLLAV
ncbi:MAG: DUF2339 domain-containing protein, partial [Rhodothermales bacterium]|nr:DUF2339 domain-containing protein [Rhodothermales bacterium]